MKFPWQKEEVYFEEKPPKPKETLHSLADKLIMRKMRADPDGYGIEAAEKLKKMRREETQSLGAQLKQLKELRAMLKELAGEEGSGGGILQTIVENLPAIIQALPQAAQQFQRQPQIEQPPIQPRLEQPKEAPVNLTDLVQFLELPPEQALDMLKENYPQWLPVLKVQTYEGIMAQLEPFRDTNPEIQEIIGRLASDEGKKWLKQLIKMAKSQ